MAPRKSRARGGAAAAGKSRPRGGAAGMGAAHAGSSARRNRNRNIVRSRARIAGNKQLNPKRGAKQPNARAATARKRSSMVAPKRRSPSRRA